MNENYSSAAASLSCLFPSIEEVHRFEYEGSSVTCPHPSQDSVGISCYFEDFYAVAEGNALTIFQFTDKDGDAISDIIAEIEFDNVLKFLQWDISGRCLALSDDQGIIHLVNRNGLLLFSKQVFSGEIFPLRLSSLNRLLQLPLVLVLEACNLSETSHHRSLYVLYFLMEVFWPLESWICFDSVN